MAKKSNALELPPVLRHSLPVAGRGRRFTASDVAAHIKRPTERIESAIERVKHWTNRAAGPGRGPRLGSGRHRSYSKIAVLEAIFLNILTEAVGMTAVRSRAFFETYVPSYLLSSKDTTNFVRISFSADKQSATFGVVHLNPNDPKDAVQFVKWLQAAENDAAILIDVGKIHAQFDATQGELDGQHSKTDLEARRG